MDREEKQIAARTEDMFRLCDKYAVPRFSPFYNEAEMETVKAAAQRAGYNIAFFGGYDDAQRCMLGVFPEWQEADYGEFPIAALRAEKGYSRELSHRDYLGTILSLGIDRAKIGDILVDDEGAYIFAAEDIADYIVMNVKKAANCGIKLKRTAVREEDLPKREYEISEAVAASARLDAVLAAALNISRRESAMYIVSGKVNINHKPVSDTSFSLKEGDLMSIRGAGRIILDEIGANTRSGRIHILLKKCVR